MRGQGAWRRERGRAALLALALAAAGCGGGQPAGDAAPAEAEAEAGVAEPAPGPEPAPAPTTVAGPAVTAPDPEPEPEPEPAAAPELTEAEWEAEQIAGGEDDLEQTFAQGRENDAQAPEPEPEDGAAETEEPPEAEGPETVIVVVPAPPEPALIEDDVLPEPANPDPAPVGGVVRLEATALLRDRMELDPLALYPDACVWDHPFDEIAEGMQWDYRIPDPEVEAYGGESWAVDKVVTAPTELDAPGHRMPLWGGQVTRTSTTTYPDGVASYEPDGAPDVFVNSSNVALLAYADEGAGRWWLAAPGRCAGA